MFPNLGRAYTVASTVAYTDTAVCLSTRLTWLSQSHAKRERGRERECESAKGIARENMGPREREWAREQVATAYIDY
jgi:hypothetical protein